MIRLFGFTVLWFMVSLILVLILYNAVPSLSVVCNINSTINYIVSTEHRAEWENRVKIVQIISAYEVMEK